MLAKGQRYIFYAQKADFYGNQKSLGTVLSLFRDKMCKNFYSVMPKNEASVMCTMILGDRGGLDDEIGDLYRKTGIYHILAISGLHITLLGTILARLFSFLGKRRAFGITMVVLLLYCIMTGCSATVVRAVIMFYIMAIGSFIYREYDVVSATAFAAMLLLIFNPYYLYDIGFELSFAVVFALGAVTDIAVKYNTQGLNTIGVAVAADLASKPILMFYFYNAGIWSIIANLMLAPIMSCTVALGFICAAVGLVNISLARLVSIPAVYILRTIESWCKVFVSLPCSYIVTGRPHMYALIGYAVLLFVCYRFIMCGKLKPTIASLTAAFIVLLLGTPAVLNKINIINNQSVTFLDDACAVIEDNGSCYIVDMGGGAIPSEYLMYRGIGEADGVFAAYNASDDSISLSEGESVEINTDSRIECVYSDGDFKVLRLACDGKTVLFTGKTDNKTQKLLCKNGYALSADVLQLNSVNEDFVKAVSPEYTVMTEKENMKATGMVTVRLTDKPTVSNYLEDE
jgi:competence protein ComEC